MSLPENKSIFIDDKEYLIDEMTEEQLLIIQHLYSLDAKINEIKFNIYQSQFCRDSFMNKLKDSLVS